MGESFDRLVCHRGRRRFLVGAGGVLALPILESVVAPRRAWAWTAAPGMPKRLIILSHGHGTVMPSLIPSSGTTPGPILQPVLDAGLGDKTLLVGGIDHKVDLRSSDNHWEIPLTMFTCRPYSTQNGTRNYQWTATGPSVEHVIGRHINDGAYPRRLDLGVDRDLSNATANSRMFWSAAHERIPSRLRPDQVFDDVFDGWGTAEPPPPEPPAANPEPAPVNPRDYRRKSVLDRVLGQYNALRGRVSASDRVRLEQHADKIRNIEQGLNAAVTTGDVDSGGGVPSGGTPSPAACGESPGLGSLSGLSHFEVAEKHMDILALASACGLADVGTFRFFELPLEAVRPLGISAFRDHRGGDPNYHSHWHSYADGDDAQSGEDFVRIGQWQASIFARLLNNLEAIDEGDGTALDNTMIVWVSEFGDGGGHAVGNVHLVLAGNIGGPRLGGYTNFSTNGATRSGPASGNGGSHNLAVNMINAFGIPDTRFGDTGSVDGFQGPLSF
ncbi:MAG: DUF1552 domain-containing protein [Myxococcota bacterium]